MAFDGVVDSPISGRLDKPRRTGQTMVIDKGTGLTQIGDLLEITSAYIDYIKMGFGTAALYPTHLLRAKVALIRSYGVDVYPGGTFLEIAVLQRALGAYLERVKSLGFTHVEVSDGTIDLSPQDRVRAIQQARDLGLAVITEVGKKDGEVHLDPEATLVQIHEDLEHGACKVIVEGRESGLGVGIFDAEGRVKSSELEALVAGLPDPAVLMWEAPHKSQQEEFILRFGVNVNLGNLAPTDVLSVESLRRGLRGDTLRHILPKALASAGPTPLW